MKFAVSQSNYIPWIGYFDLISRVDTFVIYDTVQYTKNDWRNRNRIMTSLGPHWLSVPVRKLSLNQRINETEIANKIWAKKHWKTIEQSYKRSPFFENYRAELRAIYSQEWLLLSDLNRALIALICKFLDIKTRLICSSTLRHDGDKNLRLVSFAKQLGANQYLSGPAAQSYLDESLFETAGISLEWMSYGPYEPYEQLSEEFSVHVSILDMLFNVGPDTTRYLGREQL